MLDLGNQSAHGQLAHFLGRELHRRDLRIDDTGEQIVVHRDDRNIVRHMLTQRMKPRDGSNAGQERGRMNGGDLRLQQRIDRFRHALGIIARFGQQRRRGLDARLF